MLRKITFSPAGWQQHITNPTVIAPATAANKQLGVAELPEGVLGFTDHRRDILQV